MAWGGLIRGDTTAASEECHEPLRKHHRHHRHHRRRSVSLPMTHGRCTSKKMTSSMNLRPGVLRGGSMAATSVGDAVVRGATRKRQDRTVLVADVLGATRK